MANHHDKHFSFSSSASKNSQGVRGGVAYRAASDSNVGEREYPRLLYVAVNILLAVFALAILTGLLLVFTPLGDLWEREIGRVDILYTLEFYDVNGDLGAAPTEGTRVFDAKTGQDLGEVIGVTVAPYVLPPEQWREQEPSTSPDTTTEGTARTVLLTVALSAQYEAEVGYTVHGIRIAKGLSYTLHFADSVAEGTCVSLEKRW